MAGRGFMDEVPMVENDKLFVLRNGRWRPMYRPVNPDRGTAGVCLAESFADLYSKDHPGVDVGIIPCADGGTGIDQWCVGGLLFDHACYMAELASRTSTIAAVLWHQGENDANCGMLPTTYYSYVKQMVTAIRNRYDGEKRNPWNEIESKFAVDTVHNATISEVNDKGAVVVLGENVTGFVPAKQMVKEDGTTLKAGETADFKVIEFSKATKRITLSHSRLFEEAKREQIAAEKAEKRAAADATKSSIKKVNASIEKTTLGDIAGLAELKAAMEKNK